MPPKGNAVTGKLLMDDRWQVVQQKVFTKWLNSHLAKDEVGKTMLINDVLVDLKDGLRIIKFLEILAGEQFPTKYDKKPKIRISMINNCDLAIKYLASKGVKLVAIQAENVVDGDRIQILGLIWSIIQQFQIADISEDQLNAKDALLLWCKKATKNYRDVDPPGLSNFTSCWQDGLAFCAIINRFRPDLLDYEKCLKSTPHENCEYAFRVAEEELGIARLLDVEDVVDTPKPDERSIITYVVQYYHYFAASQKGENAGRRVGKLIDFLQSIKNMQDDYSTRAAALVAWCDEKIAWLSESLSDAHSLEALAERQQALVEFKQKEKPPKAEEKFMLESLFNSIQVKLASMQRAPFKPAERLSPEEIRELWRQLELAEQERERLIREARARQRELEQQKSRFDQKKKQLDEFIERSTAYLTREEVVESLNGARTKLQELDGWRDEYSEMRALRDELADMGAKLGESDASVADETADATKRFDDLERLASEKEARLKEKLAAEQAKEEARIEWAKVVKDYVNWCKATRGDVRDDRFFGDSLESVEADAARLDAHDKETAESNALRKAAVDQCWTRLQELGVTENRYTPLTADSAQEAHDSIGDAVRVRRDAYEAALEHERQLDALRREFAAAADAFVESLVTRRTELEALDGAPDELQEKLAGVYDDGKPESAQLEALAALQDRMTAEGITSNRHTPHSMLALRSMNDLLASWVRHALDALREENEMKHSYEEKARELVAWCEATLPKLDERQVDETLEDAQQRLALHLSFKTTEKAKESNNKFNLEKLFELIGEMLRARKRPEYVPPSPLTPAEINELWQRVETAESAYAEFVRAYLARQEELDILVTRLTSDAEHLEQWCQAKQEHAQFGGEPATTLYEAQYQLVMHESHQEEVKGRQPRLAALDELLTRIVELNYGKSDELKARVAAIHQFYKSLVTRGQEKHAVLKKALALEQEKEDLRIAFGGKARDFLSWIKRGVEHVEAYNFGATLAAVTESGARIDESERALKTEADERRAELNELLSKLQALNVSEATPRHSTIRDHDVAQAHASLLDALKKRSEAYAAALDTQKSWDARRQEYAAGAKELVEWLQAQRDEVRTALNDTAVAANERVERITAIYADGSGAEQRLEALRQQSAAMESDGIVGNDYTGFSVVLLKERVKQFGDFVAEAQTVLKEEQAFDERLAQLEAESKEAEAREAVHFDIGKRARLLVNWLAQHEAALNEPLQVSDEAACARLNDELTALNARAAEKRAEVDALLSDAAAAADGGENVHAERLEAVETRWAAMEALAASRADAIAKEAERQAQNVKLCGVFADAAQKLHEWCEQQQRAVDATSGELSAQSEALAAVAAAEGEGDALLEAVMSADADLDAAGVTSNDQTELSMEKLLAEMAQLSDAIKSKAAVINEELAAKSDIGVSATQIAEYKETFQFFDKNGDRTLQLGELKACLNSLGDDVSEAEIEELFVKYASEELKRVTFDAFVQLMVDRNKNVDTLEDVLDTFRTMADGDAELISEAQLRAALDPGRADYLMGEMPRGADGRFNYAQWAKKVYS